LKGHKAGVSSVAFSPDSQRVVAGSGDQSVKIWDAATGKELLVLKGHHGHQKVVLAVAVSPDGKLVASAGEDKTVRIWDAENGQELLTLAGHTARIEVERGADLRSQLEKHARLPAEFIKAYGGDKFQPALHSLDGARP